MSAIETIYRCQNCNWITKNADKLEPVSGLYKGRILPGEIMPEGECPKCGGVCFADETPEEAAAERVRRAGPELLKALEEYVAYFDNYDIDEEFPDFQAMRDRAVGVLVIARARGVSEEDDQERARRA